ncbi:hypothetical protein GOP47_0007890 [Adiantum capillus-veneris]|uniref:Uncharacterized protein n=1 Tax=Adiantum capillus-veneris TaxID=13818 RepID=A0A9D4V289_ADICA|nr:hypothetical protein GOP47_0007890 [Adiantum capillus-veneris]
MASSMFGNKGLAVLLLAMLLAMGVASLANAGGEKGNYGRKGSGGFEHHDGKGSYGGKGSGSYGYKGHGDQGKGHMKGGYDHAGHGGHGKGHMKGGYDHAGHGGHGGHGPHA